MPTDEHRDMIRVLVANGVAHRIIAEMLGVHLTTLKRVCGGELKNGFERVKAAIGASLVRSAMSGNVSAIRYWLMTRGGEEWRVPKDDALALLDGTHPDAGDEPWLIMMPENGRDKPEPDEEDDEPITIEGEAEAA